MIWITFSFCNRFSLILCTLWPRFGTVVTVSTEQACSYSHRRAWQTAEEEEEREGEKKIINALNRGRKNRNMRKNINSKLFTYKNSTVYFFFLLLLHIYSTFFWFVRLGVSCVYLFASLPSIWMKLTTMDKWKKLLKNAIFFEQLAF